ncbi:MAG: hypothetical protein V1724_07640 [Chloroflexota bacterium]
MYLRQCRPTKCKKEHTYWELVESHRAERGPRQRVVAYLGEIAESTAVGIKQAATGTVGSWQSRLFDEEGEPEWEKVDSKRVRVEGVRDFGGCWLGLEVSSRDGHDAGPDAPL